MRATIIGVMLLLSACAPIPLALSVLGASAGTVAMVQTVGQDADMVLAADKPIKEAICAAELPHHQSAGFAAWCAHLPSDMAGLARQWAAVGRAIELEGMVP